MVRTDNVWSAALSSTALTVTKFLNFDALHGVPPLNVLYTNDEDQAYYYLKNRLNSPFLGLDVQWKPSPGFTRTSLLQVAARDWVLIYDVLPMPWYGTPPETLSERLCELLEDGERTFYGMLLPVDAARIAFELNCVITKGVDLRRNPWPHANFSGGLVHVSNEVLNTTVREDRDIAMANWEWRPLTGEQLRFMAEKAYLTWAIADHYLRTEGPPNKDATLTEAQIYGAGGLIRKLGTTAADPAHDWSGARDEWLHEKDLENMRPADRGEMPEAWLRVKAKTKKTKRTGRSMVPQLVEAEPEAEEAGYEAYDENEDAEAIAVVEAAEGLSERERRSILRKKARQARQAALAARESVAAADEQKHYADYEREGKEQDIFFREHSRAHRKKALAKEIASSSLLAEEIGYEAPGYGEEVEDDEVIAVVEAAEGLSEREKRPMLREKARKARKEALAAKKLAAATDEKKHYADYRKEEKQQDVFTREHSRAHHKKDLAKDIASSAV